MEEISLALVSARAYLVFQDSFSFSSVSKIFLLSEQLSSYFFSFTLNFIFDLVLPISIDTFQH